jgi:hypothetical protein
MEKKFTATKSQETKYRDLVAQVQKVDRSFRTDWEECRGDVHPDFGHFFVKINTHPHALIGIELTASISRRGKIRFITLSSKGNIPGLEEKVREEAR